MATTLPQELWQLVVASKLDWTYNELRSLRLASKHLNTAANPVLFHTLLLRPNGMSLRRICYVCDSPQLRIHVRKLLFRSSGVDEGVHNTAQFIQLMHETPIPASRLTRLTTYAEQYFRGYSLMQKSQRAYRTADPVLTLRNVCAHLPNVKTLESVVGDDSLSHFAQLYGTEIDWATGLELNELLQVSKAVKPTSLTLPRVEWAYFMKLELDLPLDEDFSGLQDLKHFSFSIDPPGLDRWEVAHFLLFQQFLNPALKNVEELTFGLDEPQDRVDSTYPKIVAALLEQKWPRLRYLTISQLECNRGELTKFLQRHRRTLTDVTLDFIIFKDEGWGDQEDFDRDAMYAPVTDFLVALREKLTLKRFRLKRWLGMSGWELYQIRKLEPEERYHPFTFLDTVQEFVSHQGWFPWTGYEKRLGMSRYIVKAPKPSGEADEESDEDPIATAVSPASGSSLSPLPDHTTFPEELDMVMLNFCDESWKWRNYVGERYTNPR